MTRTKEIYLNSRTLHPPRHYAQGIMFWGVMELKADKMVEMGIPFKYLPWK